MSIINKVLNDLDKRNQPGNAQQGHGSAVAAARPRRTRTLLWVVLVALAALATISYVLRSPDDLPEPTAAQNTQAEALPAEETAETEAANNEATQNEVASQVASPTPAPITVDAQATTALQNSLTERAQREPKPAVATERAQPAPSQPTEDQARAINKPEQQAEQPASPTSDFSKKAVSLSREELAERALQKAQQAERQGLFSDAASHYQAALTAQPQWHDARKSWVALEYGRGQITQALSILREGLQHYPQAHSLRLLAASMLEKQSDERLALQLLLQAQPDAQQLPQYYQLQAMLAQQLDDETVMQQSYQALVQAQPDNGRWRLGLALALRESNPQQAIAEFEQAAVRIEHRPTLNFIAEQIKRLRSQHATSTP